MKYKGIDVSKWQGRINWNLVKADGVKFAMLRSSFGRGPGNKDILFETNYEKAKKLGIHVGAYHYSYARTPEEAVMEAEYCHSVLKDKVFEYPIAYDMEESGVAALGKEKISQIAKAFCEKMEGYGYYVCIYANKHWLENYFTDEILGNYDIWLAQWTEKPTFKRPYGLWQKTAKGKINGINGYVDIDEAYKHYPSIMKLNGLNGFPKKKPSKTENYKPVIKNYAAGEMVKLKNASLYASSSASKEVNKISGEYYIYDDKIMNDRMRITNSRDKVLKRPVGQNVTGYIKRSEFR